MAHIITIPIRVTSREHGLETKAYFPTIFPYLLLYGKCKVDVFTLSTSPRGSERVISRLGRTTCIEYGCIPISTHVLRII